MAITSINLGKIKFNWRGAWALGVTYVKDDVVRYNGSTYVCTVGHLSATDWSTNSGKFELMTQGASVTTTSGDLQYNDGVQDIRLPIGNEGQVLSVENGIPAWVDAGVNDIIYYVSPTGNDTNSGLSWGTSFATIKHACSVAVGPATIRVASGVYTEQLPIKVPNFVAVIGDSIRTTIVQPAQGYQHTTMWQLGDGALLNKMHFIGLTGFIPYAFDDTNLEQSTVGGVFVAFNPDEPILTKSPYVIECTAKATGAVGALVDGSVHNTGIKSMVFHGYTIICDSGLGYWIKDAAKAEIVSCFTYYCHVGYATTGGGKIRALNGNNSYGTYGALSHGYNLAESTVNGTVYGNMLTYDAISLSGTFSEGDTITGLSSNATGVITSVQTTANHLYYHVTSGTFQEGETIDNGNGSTATISTGGVTGQKGFILVVTGLNSEPKNGGSIEIAGDNLTYVIQSSTGWVNSSSHVIIVVTQDRTTAVSHGAVTKIRYDYSQVRLTGHDFLSVGTGGVTTTNYPGTPLQASDQGNEVVEQFPGRVFYVSTDQDGNFRVGEFFKVDQATGKATLNASAFDLSGLSSLRMGSIGAQLGAQINEFSTDVTLSGDSNTAVPTEHAVKTYFTQVSSNTIPAVDDLYTLGTPSKRWNHVYVGPGSITLGSLTLTDNAGTLDVQTSGNPAPATFNSISNGTSTIEVAQNGPISIFTNGGLAAEFLANGNLHVNGNVTFGGQAQTIAATNVAISDNMLYLNSPVTATVVNATGDGTHQTYTATAHDFSEGMVVTVSGMTPSGYNCTNQTITAVTENSFSILGSETGTYSAGGTARAKAGVNPDFGLAAGYTSGSYKHTGLFRDASDNVWKFFDGYTPEPDADIYIDTTHASFALGDLQVDNMNAVTYQISGTTVLSGSTLGSSITDSSLTSVGTLTALTVSGTVAANGSGGITTTQTGTVPLFNTNATGINLGSAATAVRIGATSGTLTIGNPTVVGTQTSQDVFNTVATTVNAFGAATTVNIGAQNANTITNIYNKIAIKGSTSGAFTIQVPATAGSVTYTLPSADGTSGYALVTNGSGTLSWAAAGATITDDTSTNSTYYPLIATATSGSATAVKVSSSKFTFNPSSGLLTVTSITESSSIALKENVNPITNALDAIMQLVGVTYDRKDGSKKNEAGLIAEDVFNVLPNLITLDENGKPNGINYSKLSAYLIEAVKTLKTEINELKGSK